MPEQAKSLIQRRGETVNVPTLVPASMVRQGKKEIIPDDKLKQAMKRRAQGVSAIQQQFFSPFRTRSSLEAPTKRVDLNEWYRYYFKHDPYVGAAVELHATYPLSNFNIEHEDKEYESFFNDEKDRLELESLVRRMGLEYWLVGEAYVFGFLDKTNEPTTWERFILLDPDKIKINKHPLAVGKHNRDYHILLEPDADLKKIVDNGPHHQNTGALYRNIPVDVIESVRRGQPIPLHPLQVSHFKREVNPFNVRGESIISRVLQDLMYLDKIRDAQFAVADRHVMPTEIYMIGEPGDPADEGEMLAFKQVLESTYHSHNRAIIWHHALKVQIEGASGKILPLRPEFDVVKERLLAGLMMSSAIVGGDGPSFANASVAMDVLIARYMEYREKLANWMIRHVFDPICRMNDIYRPTEAEMSHRIRVKHKVKRPWVPTITWERGSLRDDQFKIGLYERLVGQNLLPRIDLYRAINKNPKKVALELATQMKDDEEARKHGKPVPGQPNVAGVGGKLPSPGGLVPPAAGPGKGLPGAGVPPKAKLPVPGGGFGGAGAGEGAGALPQGTVPPPSAGMGPANAAPSGMPQ